MKTIIKFLRLILILMSLGLFIEYCLVTSDVPPTVTKSNVVKFMTVYIIFGVIAVADFILCLKIQYRGGYLTPAAEMFFLILWVFSYSGANIHLDNMLTNDTDCNIITILIGGISTCVIQCVLSTVNIISAYAKRKSNCTMTKQRMIDNVL